MTSDSLAQIAQAELHALVLSALLGHGASDAQARAVADTVTAAERDGSHSHGIFRVPGYVASLRSGKVDGQAVPVLSRPAPASVVVDAAGGFAPLALATGIPALCETARATGVAVLSIGNCYHFAALWHEVEAIAAEGLIGFACTVATPMVAPAGGARPFFGTNPLAYAVPRPGRLPLVVDQASAAMARGDIMLAAEAGRAVPEGVGLGPDGAPSTDPARILEGAQLPFGGYKGAAIALLIEILAGGAIGGPFSDEAGAADNADGGPPVGGEFLMALDPAQLGGGSDWQQRIDGFLDRLSAIPGTRLPGARRHERRKALAAGSPLSVNGARLTALRQLADTRK
ncbi:MAG: Ldh family oxidoreductase [Pseudomonadota bacterium]